MALSLGSSLASKVYLGATEVALAYLGATQVYTSSAFSAEAQDYFDRLDTAGDTTYVDYKQPLANYIDSLVALGGAYWDTMESSTSFVGVGIQGVTVPLRDGMTVPTQNNFVAADLDQLTGLKGDASTKVIDTNLLSNDISQNDGSLSVYQTEAVTSGNYTAGSGFNGGIGGGVFLRDLGSTIQCAVHGGLVSNGTGWVSGLVGGSRSSSTTQTQRTNQTDYPFSSTSLAPTTDVIRVFAAGASPKTDPRLATYHIGPALNLATLEGLQDTLLSEIAGIGFSTEAANYFSRLVSAGDTTFLAYRQPLANYIDSLVTLGGAYWDTMESAASFVGVGIKGITVPLRDGMTVPTQNNFVAGDLDQLTGLLCNGSSKRISTNTDQSNYAQNDTSASTYRTETVSGTNPFYFGTNLANGFGARGTASFITACYGAQAVTGSASTTVGLLGLSRSVSTGYDYRSNGTTGTRTTASVTPASGNLDMFAINGTTSGSFRLATYHAGPALNLATLEGLQDTLLSEIRTAHTFVAAASYFSRLAAAGDTTHVAYKQPLTNYITSLVELGGAYWDTMQSSASFVGVGIQGITVPLRAGMASITNVNNNFVAGDLDQLTGLKGDGSTKYIATNVAGTALLQDDASASVHITTAATGANKFYMTNAGGASLSLRSTPQQSLNSSSLATLGTVPTSGIYGASRSSSTTIDVRSNQTSYSAAITSIAPSANDLYVYSIGATPSADARLATYHAGPALDLATLEGLQDTLITEIAAI